MTSYKPHFSRALAAAPERLHFAAHSHHLWPDVTFEAQRRYWEDSAQFVDMKWDHVFGDVLQRLRERVARVLGLPDPSTLVFAPSTHELVVRLLSCFEEARPVRILTTDGEFHSFRRQWMRLAESRQATVDVVATEPFDTFPERFVDATARGTHDLVYISHVMFDSGFIVPNVDAIVEAVSPHAEIVVDGYHHFMAIPTTLEKVAARAFYTSGGYKYAMSGEGACFMHCPPGRCARPVNTGWFAGFGHLTSGPSPKVPYGTDGSRFAGATFDPTGAYRLDAVLGLLSSLRIGVEDIHVHVRALQERFLERIAEAPLADVALETLIPDREAKDRGHFLTFRTPRAGVLHERLAVANIVTDFRGDRLRFGFGLYHDRPDVDALVERAADALG